MFMSVIEKDTDSAAVYPELVGLRVLITGVSEQGGIDVARAFADHGCRLVLQADHDSPEIAAIGEVLCRSDSDVRMFTEALGDGEAAVKFAQKASQVFGGLEVVVNLVTFSADDLAHVSSAMDLEDVVSAKLLPMTLLTRVAANRMRLTLKEGLILNVVLMPQAGSPAQTIVAGIARGAVAALTRGEAQKWAGEALRINAIAPRDGSGEGEGACLNGEPHVAALALHLASKRGKRLSGLVFDAATAA